MLAHTTSYWYLIDVDYIMLIKTLCFSQSGYTIQVINEGEEPENFFWVALGGRKSYDKVNLSKSMPLFYSIAQMYVNIVLPISCGKMRGVSTHLLLSALFFRSHKKDTIPFVCADEIYTCLVAH